MKSGIKSFVFTGFNSFTFIYSSFIIQSNVKYTMGCKDCSNPQKSNHVFWFCLVLFLFCFFSCVCLFKVFQKQESAETCNDEDVAGSILRLFPGFDAFSLPPPTYDPDALKYLKQGKSQTAPGKTNPLFWSRLQDFKYFLKPFLAPKRSCSDTEFVTGEGK